MPDRSANQEPCDESCLQPGGSVGMDVRWLQVTELAVDAHVVLGYSHNVSQDRFVISQNAISVRGN